MKKTLIALTATAALALTACGTVPTDDTKTVTSTETATVEPSTSTETEPATAEPATSTPAPAATTSDDTTPFGETYEWEDNVKVMLSEPTAYQPSSYAAGGEGYDHKITFNVTIVNGSEENLDASFASPALTSGTREGDEIFDEVVGGGPMSAILPGRTVTFQVAYGIDDPSDVVAEFAPTWDHNYAYWTN